MNVTITNIQRTRVSCALKDLNILTRISVKSFNSPIYKRTYCVQPAKMSKFPTEIPSMTLNDGTSIPMVIPLPPLSPQWY